MGETAQQVEALAAAPANLSSMSEIHRVEGRRQIVITLFFARSRLVWHIIVVKTPMYVQVHVFELLQAKVIH